MAMKVITDHQLTVSGNDRMTITDTGGGLPHVTARRQGGVWTISAASVADVTETDCHEAIQKMKHHAKLSLTGSAEGKGFSTWVPHSAHKLDGQASYQAWRDKHQLGPDPTA